MTGKHPTDYDWSADKIAQLTQLWAAGLSGTEIGQRLGTTKSAVVGKVHRLNLPGRPSPIRRRYALSPTELARRDAESKQRSAERNQRDIEKSARRQRARVESAPPGEAVRPMSTDAESRRAAYAAAGTNGKGCSWPIGHPGEPDYHYCTNKAVIGKPWCADHCVIGYVAKRSATTRLASQTFLSEVGRHAGQSSLATEFREIGEGQES